MNGIEKKEEKNNREEGVLAWGGGEVGDEMKKKGEKKMGVDMMCKGQDRAIKACKSHLPNSV